METIKTNDLTLFKKYRSNRDINETNLSRIVASIKLNNMLELRPILVNANMEVVDGQHRLEAAKQLGLEVFYQVLQDAKPQDIILLNANQRRWGPEDYIHFHAQQGNENFMKLVNFAKKMCTDPLEAATFLLGYRHTSNETSSSCVKDGTFIFPSEEGLKPAEESYEKMYRCLDVLKLKLIGSKTWINGRRCRSSLFCFVSTEQVNVDIFVNKILLRIDLIHPCANGPAFGLMWKAVYNYRNQDPLP